MTVKQWFTVFAVYDDNEQPWTESFEAKDVAEARSKALRKADGVILIAGIVLGKVTPVDIDGLDNIVPIRGKGHAIEVTHVRISKRKFVIPGRCPGCKKDLRRANAMIESFLMGRTWPAHLSHNGKDLVPERDVITRHGHIGPSYDIVKLTCSDCRHVVWEGLHDD